MENIFEMQADVCKVFSNATRLEIINLLEERELSTGELMRLTGLSKVNISQHMNVLKGKGVISARREGVAVYYRIASPKIIQACHLMREVLLEQLQEKGRVFSGLAGLVQTQPGGTRPVRTGKRSSAEASKERR